MSLYVKNLFNLREKRQNGPEAGEIARKIQSDH